VFIPRRLLAVLALLVAVLAGWAALLAQGRNPLPVPDPGSRVFAAASPEARAAVVDVLAEHGLAERFRADTPDVLRSILYDGTIVNYSAPAITAGLGGATSSIGIVADDPPASAAQAADALRARGFSARVVADSEPGMPVVHVVTDALPGSTLNFRPHALRMPRPPAE
jgi:hypothetical protein